LARIVNKTYLEMFNFPAATRFLTDISDIKSV